MASLLPFSLLKPTTICKATAAPATTTSPSVDSLNEQFGRKGIKFTEETANPPLVELSVRNGSSLRLQIPNAHVSSYKPKVHWKDDGFEELLYSTLLGGSPKGGIGLVLNDVTEPLSAGGGSNVAKRADPFAARRSEPPSVKGSVLAGVEWSVKDVDSDSFDAVQVELSSKSGTLDITYVVSLYPESIATAVIVKNTGQKAVKLTSAMLSHIRFKNRGGSGIQGLQGCSYCAHPPLSSPFEFLSPAEAMKVDDPGLFSFSSEPPSKPGEWNTQNELITILKNKFSRVYTAPPSERSKAFYRTPPSKYETVDQGRGLVFRVIRMGYDDIYLSSPGSFSEKYGRDYFICTGPASMLVPVTVNPGETWKGAQAIEHDNLT